MVSQNTIKHPIDNAVYMPPDFANSSVVAVGHWHIRSLCQSTLNCLTGVPKSPGVWHSETDYIKAIYPLLWDMLLC